MLFVTLGGLFIINCYIGRPSYASLATSVVFPITSLCLTVYCGDIVLLTVGVYSSNHGVLYTIGISVTRRFQKSVGPSVRRFVTQTKKPTPLSLLTVE